MASGEAERLRSLYLRRAIEAHAPGLAAAHPECVGSMRELRRAGLQRLAALRRSREAQAAQGGGPPGSRGAELNLLTKEPVQGIVRQDPGLRPGGAETPQKRVERLYSELQEARSQLDASELQQLDAHLVTTESSEYISVAAGWDTLIYVSADGCVTELPIDEVSQKLVSGDITEDTLVMVEGMPDWAPFRTFVAMYGLEDELLPAATPSRPAHLRAQLVEDALDSPTTRHSLRQPDLLTSVSRQQDAERRRDLLRRASQTSITVLSPISRTGSAVSLSSAGTPLNAPGDSPAPTPEPQPEPEPTVDSGRKGRRKQKKQAAV